MPEHEQLLDLVQTRRGELLGAERDFVLEGVRRGTYADSGREPFLDDARVVVGPGLEIYINDQLIHHGSLWTNKSLTARHREHLKNCVKDSQAWREKTENVSLEDVVEQLAQRFGEYDPESKMYVRLHRREGPKASVKVLVGGRSCEHCQHCEAYELVNELLGCQAQHGPKAGWATDEMRRWAQMIRRRGGV